MKSLRKSPLLGLWSLSAFSLSLFSFGTHAVPHEDLVESLPLFGEPPTPMYSGFLDATEGCDTTVNGEYCKLHYWLAAAEGDSCFCDDSKPVILWLNGGPGSSSVVGFLQEMGPLLINAKGDGLMQNPYAWTKVAHLFILESPVGVGFSHCQAQEDPDKTCVNTDKFTASPLVLD
jgi:hypothetical protein